MLRIPSLRGKREDGTWSRVPWSLLKLDGVWTGTELDHVVMVFVEKLVVSSAQVSSAVPAELGSA